MTRLPKGWRGLKDVRGVYVKAKTPYQVERNLNGMWQCYGEGAVARYTLLATCYAKATDAMKAVDRHHDHVAAQRLAVKERQENA